MQMRAYNVFMKTDLSKYIDEWIAIVDDEIVSHGKDVKVTYDKAVKKYPDHRVMVAKVPGKRNCIF